MNDKPTLKEIAALSKLSIPTISRALSNPQLVKYSTRLKVQSAVMEIQKQSRKSKSGIIGIIIPDISNQFFPSMLAWIDCIALSSGNTTMICNTNGKPKYEETALKKFLDIKADGIIYITTGNATPLLLELIEDNSIPIVFLDRNPDIEGINLITTDNKNCMYQGTKYLTTLGHKKILYIGGKENTSTDDERIQGFLSAINEAELKIDSMKIVHANFSTEMAFSIVNKEMLQKDDFEYTAVIAANDMMALGAIQALQLGGLKIPEDVSVIGYDDIPAASFAKLTTIHQPFFEMGSSAILQLLASIENPNTPKKTTILPSSIVFRDSCSIPKPSRL